MQTFRSVLAIATMAFAGVVLAADGLVILKSPHNAKDTMSRLEEAVKALVWEDAGAQVWVGYNDPAYLAQRHGVSACPVVETLRTALAGVAEAAVAR